MRYSFALIVFALAGAFGSQTAQAPDVIATVDDEPIFRDKLLRDKPSCVSDFFRAHKRAPESADDERLIERCQTEVTCDMLRRAIRSQIASSERKKYKVEPTAEHIERIRQKTLRTMKPKETAERNAAHAQAFFDAFTDVYDRKMDPKVVYKNRADALKMEEWSWLMMVYTNRTSNWRDLYSQQAKLTADQYIAGAEKADFRLLAVSELIADARDDLVASRDPKYKALLAEERRVKRESGDGSTTFNAQDSDYMDVKMVEYWKQEYSKSVIIVRDPALAKSCDVTNLLRGVDMRFFRLIHR